MNYRDYMPGAERRPEPFMLFFASLMISFVAMAFLFMVSMQILGLSRIAGLSQMVAAYFVILLASMRFMFTGKNPLETFVRWVLSAIFIAITAIGLFTYLTT